MTRWVPIVGFEHRYLISDDGQIKATAAPGRGRPNADRILKLSKANGYLQVKLHPGRNEPPIPRRIHQLVLEHFVGPRPPGEVGRHLNDNRLDNRVENLAWGSLSDNTQDLLRNGHHWQASKTHCKYGHVLAGENLYRTPDGSPRPQRMCRTCSQRRREEYATRKREARLAEHGEVLS